MLKTDNLLSSIPDIRLPHNYPDKYLDLDINMVSFPV